MSKTCVEYPHEMDARLFDSISAVFILDRTELMVVDAQLFIHDEKYSTWFIQIIGTDANLWGEVTFYYEENKIYRFVLWTECQLFGRDEPPMSQLITMKTIAAPAALKNVP